MTASKSEEQALKEVGELEELRCKALLAKDSPTLRRLFADTLMYTHSTGRVDDADSYLEQRRTSRSLYSSMRREDVRMIVHGDMVFCTGRVLADIDNKDGPPTKWVARYSNVWIKTGQGWKMALWQATTLPNP